MIEITESEESHLIIDNQKTYETNIDLQIGDMVILPAPKPEG